MSLARVVVCASLQSLAPAIAAADPSPDAGAALTAFVASTAAGEIPADAQAFIAPRHDREQAVADASSLTSIAAAPKLTIAATHLATSGTAAWIIGRVSGAKYQRGGKIATDPLRASAFLTLDRGAWHVRAAHISAGTPNHPQTASCGNIDPGYEPPNLVPPGSETAAKTVTDAFAGVLHRGASTATHVMPALSGDPDAQMCGSAAGETFTGRAAIKAIFKGWNIELYADQGEHVRAGIAPGKDVARVATDVQTSKQCASYRALFVVQKDGNDWIVHPHFSDWALEP